MRVGTAPTGTSTNTNRGIVESIVDSLHITIHGLVGKYQSVVSYSTIVCVNT